MFNFHFSHQIKTLNMHFPLIFKKKPDILRYISVMIPITQSCPVPFPLHKAVQHDSHYTKLSITIPITQSCPARFPLHKLKLSSTSPEGGKDGSRLCWGVSRLYYWKHDNGTYWRCTCPSNLNKNFTEIITIKTKFSVS